MYVAISEVRSNQNHKTIFRHTLDREVWRNPEAPSSLILDLVI